MRGVALVGRQTAMPKVGRSRQDTRLAYLGLAGNSHLAGGAYTWIARLTRRFDGGVDMEDVSRWAVVARNTRWRGLGSREGVVGQAGLDGQWEMGD